MAHDRLWEGPWRVEYWRAVRGHRVRPRTNPEAAPGQSRGIRFGPAERRPAVTTRCALARALATVPAVEGRDQRTRPTRRPACLWCQVEEIRQGVDLITVTAGRKGGGEGDRRLTGHIMKHFSRWRATVFPAHDTPYRTNWSLSTLECDQSARGLRLSALPERTQSG